MDTAKPLPYYIPVEPRELQALERAVVARMLVDVTGEYLEQLDELRVVGRCGCGKCPIIFFNPPEDPSRERLLVAHTGLDDVGGLVGALLFTSSGRLSQLDLYSVDGHEPWLLPRPESMECSDKPL